MNALSVVWMILSLGTLGLMAALTANAFSQKGALESFRKRGMSFWELGIVSLVGSALFPLLWYYIYQQIKEARRCRE